MQFHPEASHEIFQVRKRISSISFAMPCILYSKRSFYQDGLGTNLGNRAHKKGAVSYITALGGQ
eukprot:COSAG06_NODE_10762_length_1621_cov_2.371222_3_plen_64_part_00